MRFVALDVETANADRGSVCQLGICLFEDGEETDSFATFINPGCQFDSVNTNIHGITYDAVIEAPSFLAIFGAMRAFMRDSVVVSHGAFDRQAISTVCAKAGVEVPDCIWIDSVSLARQAWPDLQSYRLDALAAQLHIEFDHHDAMHDARTAGLVALAAIEAMQRPFEEIVHVYGYRAVPAKPSTGSVTSPRQTFAGRKPVLARDHSGGDGPLGGHRIVFTGALSISRDEAARMAADLGAQCSDSVSKKTTLLVVGDADLPPARQDKGTGLTFTTFVRSGKHAKVETLNAAGSNIRIIGETEFTAMCDYANAVPASPSVLLARAMAADNADAAVSALIEQAELNEATELAEALREGRQAVASGIRTLSNITRRRIFMILGPSLPAGGWLRLVWAGRLGLQPIAQLLQRSLVAGG